MKKVFPFIGLLVAVAAIAAAIVWTNKNRKKKEENKKELARSIPPDSTQVFWYKNALIYTLDVKTFKDSDGDGTGDFNGLTQKLGYLDSLGADVIWLAPFQPSPHLDDGYDISDYYSVDPQLGSEQDFKAFIAAANKRHMRVVMDLVINHTSDQHPWFQQARKDKNSPYRSWYVWTDEQPKNYDKGMVFPGVQQEIWSYDTLAGQYYYHRFYKFQPDLNSQNPAVRQEVRKIIKRWMDAGIAGFRLDAVPFYIEVPQTKNDKYEHRYEMLADLRSYVDSLRPDAIILGEANVAPEETENFFGKSGEGIHMMLNFFVNQRIFYALATGEVKPLKEALEATRDIPRTSEWGQFLRNHDEVDLGRLSNSQREEVYKAMGPKKTMQLYDRGVRRRLAPMLNNNRQRLELAYSLLFALPSTPVIRYGDEIGMGDDLTLKERMSVRTPMQWTDAAPGAGFSTSDTTILPLIADSTYGYRRINVAREERDPNSLLRWTERMVRLRKSRPEIAYGTWHLLETQTPGILALHYNWQGRNLVVLHNFSQSPGQVSVKTDSLERLSNLIRADVSTASGDGYTHSISIEGWGYRWYNATVRQP